MQEFPVYKPDSTDYAILRLLQKDAFLTHKEIGAALGLSTTPIYERIRRLENAGIIAGYVALLDKTKAGIPLVVFCSVSLKEHALHFLEEFESSIKNIAAVTEVWHIAGNFDYLLKVVVRDMSAYQDFLVHQLAGLDNIGHAHSSFVMTEVKHTTEIPI